MSCYRRFQCGRTTRDGIQPRIPIRVDVEKIVVERNCEKESFHTTLGELCCSPCHYTDMTILGSASCGLHRDNRVHKNISAPAITGHSDDDLAAGLLCRSISVQLSMLGHETQRELYELDVILIVDAR